MTERFPDDNELQCAWDDFLEAEDQAKHTRRFSDAKIAGRLWRRFLYRFADPENLTADNHVVRLPSARERQARGKAI